MYRNSCIWTGETFHGRQSGSAGRLGKILSEYRQRSPFDEIEKAHRLIWDVFLQMLDAARITLTDHRDYDFPGSISSAPATLARSSFYARSGFR
jgi:hypothetical protein